MSELYPVIEDIISLLNNKYGTDITADQVLKEAEDNANKKEFTEDDIKWLVQKLKSHTFSGGVPGLTKLMKHSPKFNMHLVEQIEAASRKFGDLEGVVKFLGDYENLKDKLPKSPSSQPKTQRLDIATPVRKVKKYVEKVKKDHPDKYPGSFYQYTSKVLDQINKYQRSGERYPRLERELLGLFVGEGDEKPGLIKGWRRLKVKGVSEAVKEIYETMAPWVENEEISKQDIINPPKESPLAPLERAVRQLGDKPNKVEDTEMEINKEMKGENRKEIKDIVKDVKKDDAYKHAFDIVKAYLKKAKTSFPKDFDQYSLHKYTADLLEVMEDYRGGEGRDAGTNAKISAIFKDEPGIMGMWDEIHKPIAKRLREMRGSFNALVKTKLNDTSSIDTKTLSKIEELNGRTSLKVSDKDKMMAKALIGKREKEFPDQGTDIDPTFFNKLVKELVKHKEELPKKPATTDLKILNLTKEELEKAKSVDFMNLVSKTLQAVDQILLDDDGISDDDIVTKVIKKFKSDAEKSKEKQKHDKDVVMDRDLKKEDEDAKKKVPNEKQSSTNIISSYMGSLFYKLERLASMSQDQLVRAELEDIVQDIKQIL